MRAFLALTGREQAHTVPELCVGDAHDGLSPNSADDAFPDHGVLLPLAVIALLPTLVIFSSPFRRVFALQTSTLATQTGARKGLHAHARLLVAV